jgi:hypothetical protein
MKFQIGLNADSKGKLIANKPPDGSKFDGTDGWI